MDAEPLIGPVRGGTVVNIWGNNFERRNITCKFDNQTVAGTYISKQHIICTSPKVPEPGTVKLTVKYSKDRFQSDVLHYTYFADPEVQQLEPTCGPVEGYTQFVVTGKNFIEQGFGQAKCVFNETIFMNATVINPTTMVCDSPALDSVNPEMWYNVSVTLDGGAFVSNATGIFRYYHEPTLSDVTPWLGPLEGGTVSVVSGAGFN